MRIHYDNKFLDLMSNPMMKAGSVTRYSTMYQIRPESLSDHIVDTSFMAYIIARNLIVLGEEVDMGLLLMKTIIHDYDEPVIGDIPRLTKYATEESHRELTKVANIVAKQISKEVDGTDYSYEIWSHDKDVTQIEGVIMKIVDMFSVVKKAVTEVDMLGNMHFLKIVEEVKTYMKDLQEINMSAVTHKESKDYLLGLITDAWELLDSVSRSHETKKNQYTMYDSITEVLVDNGVSNKL